jgi:hypothetical protein
MEQGKTSQILTDLGSRSVLMSIDRSVPLPEGSTLKNEVILYVESSLMRGLRVCARNLRASCIYRAKYLQSRYLKKLVRV